MAFNSSLWIFSTKARTRASSSETFLTITGTSSISAARAARRAAPQPRSRRTIYDPALGKNVSAPVYWRFDMRPGSSIKGPAIIAEDETSTIVGARFSATINSLGYIVMERKP